MIASEPCGSDPEAWVAIPSGSLLEASPSGAWLRAFDIAAGSPERRAA